MNGISQKLIRRLDMLDGKRDGRYVEHSLDVFDRCGPGRGAGTPDAYVPNDDINCRSLSRKLNTLIRASEHIPFYRNIVAGTLDESGRAPRYPTREDLLGAFFLNQILSMIAQDPLIANSPIGELFERVNFRKYSDDSMKIVRDYPIVKIVSKTGRQDIYDPASGYGIMKYLGRKYRFKFSPFKPLTPSEKPYQKSIPRDTVPA